MLSEQLEIASRILAGFAANPAVFAADSRCGWKLVNATEKQLADYAAKMAEELLKTSKHPGKDAVHPPVTTGPSGTEAKVCEDIQRRQQLGLAKYGVSVENNPLTLREWLQHAYEESLDKTVYMRRAIDEMDKEKLPSE